MKRRRRLILCGLAAFGLVALHQLAASSIKHSFEKDLRDHGSYPARIGSFRTILPLGRFWLRDASFRSQLPEGTIRWTMPNAKLELNPLRMLQNRYEIREFQIRGLGWEASFPHEDLRLSGMVRAEGHSGTPAPADLPEDSAWCEQVLVQCFPIQGQLRGKSVELFEKMKVSVHSLTFVDGFPVRPFDLSFRADFMKRPELGQLLIDGSHDPHKRSLTADIRIIGLQRPTIERYLPVLEQVSGLDGLAASDWIESGSVSIRLRVDPVTEVRMAGNLTLRFDRVKFGKLVRGEEEQDPIALLLSSLEGKEETIQLGPVPFEGSPLLLEEEIVPKICTGLLAQLVALDPGAAVEAGGGILRKIMGK